MNLRKKRIGKKKFTWRGKVFYPARDLAGHGLPPKLRLTTNQGVCGTAYRHGHDTSKLYVKSELLLPEALTKEEIIRNNLTQEQLKLMDGILFAASCPLIIKKKIADIQIKKVIGVLNVESRELSSAAIFTDTKLKDTIYEKIAELGNIFITLHVD